MLTLMELVNCQLAAIEPNGKVVRMLLLDFWKAFDMVDHTILLPKLANTLLPNFLVKWITGVDNDIQVAVDQGTIWTDKNNMITNRMVNTLNGKNSLCPY